QNPDDPGTTAQEIDKGINEGEVDPGDVLNGPPSADAPPPVLAAPDPEPDPDPIYWLPKPMAGPDTSAQAYTEFSQENGACFIISHTFFAQPDGSRIEKIEKVWAPSPDPNIGHVTFGPNGTTTTYYNNGSFIIRDRGGKTIGIAAPPVRIEPPAKSD